MSYFKKSQELQPGDMFNAEPWVEEEIERAIEANDIPYDGWEEKLRRQAEASFFEVNDIEYSDDEDIVIVYAIPENITIPVDEDVEVED